MVVPCCRGMTQTERVTLAIGESLIQCNAFALHLAYQNQSRTYDFSVFPRIHAADVPYSFFNGEPTDGFGIPINTTIAQTMQSYFVDFAMVGTKPGSSATAFPVYTAQAKTLNISGVGDFVVTDPAANKRCRFWVEGLYS